MKGRNRVQSLSSTRHSTIISICLVYHVGVDIAQRRFDRSVVWKYLKAHPEISISRETVFDLFQQEEETGKVTLPA